MSQEGELLAAVMTCGAEAALSHDHATYLWGMLPPWAEVDLSTIHVTVPPSSGRGRRRGIIVHRSPLSKDERILHGAIPVTTPARTLVDYAARAELRALERAVDQSVTDGIVTSGKLRDAAMRHGRRPGGAAMRGLLGAAERYDSLTRSELEEAFLELVRSAGLPAPELNRRIERLRVDAVWRRERVAVELDGYRWHRTRARVEADRHRELILRKAGWFPLRYSARQVFEEGPAVLVDVATVLARRRAPQ